MYLFQPALNAKSAAAAALPVLAGEPAETVFGDAVALSPRGMFVLARNERGWVIGHASMPVVHGCEEAASRLYADLFSAADGLSLCRIWNYIPRINELGTEGLENYRAFCRGRSLAFERAWGKGFERALPSASAVGTDDDVLTVVFAACAVAPQFVENPEQVAAYHYPERYGPRPPSFSRAAVVHQTDGSRDVFISGTAAVAGHETVSPGFTEGQIASTLRNLRLISAACGLGESLGRGDKGTRHFKVYLRRANDLGEVRPVLERDLFGEGDRVTYLRSDICRADLNLEIEATVLGVE